MQLRFKSWLTCEQGAFRYQNEDSAYMEDNLSRWTNRDAQGPGFWAVFDGIGGNAGGEVAAEESKIAIKCVLEKLLPKIGKVWTVPDAITAAVQAAVASVQSFRHQYHNLGTTIALLVWCDGKLFRAHLGDSRIYRLRGATLTQLTKDHWLGQGLSKCIGGSDPDKRDPYDDHDVPEIAEIDVQAGDRFLLTTDGVNLPNEQLCQLLAAAADPEEATDTIVQASLLNGSKDNVTAVAVFVSAATQ